MNSFIKQKQFTDTEKKFIVTKGERRKDKLGVWDEQINKSLLYSIGNYIQYNHNRKESEKEYTYIHTHTYI